MINLFRSVPTGDELDALAEVLESRWWAQGSKVKEFEDQWAEKTGARFAIATNSCTAALEIAVRVAGLPMDVSTTAFTFVSTALAIYNADKRVVFKDIDPHSLCTDSADIQVLYGGNDYGSGIIYDMAHFGGGPHKGLISCWSFHAVKNLPTGDGGMLTTNDPEIARRARALSWCGIDKSTFDRSKENYSWDYNIPEPGLKANMNDITAAIGLAQLPHLSELNKFRAQLAEWYDQFLRDDIRRPFPSTTWHLYVLRVLNRDQLYNTLAAAEIQAGVHYKPLYKYPFLKQSPLPRTEKAFHEVISLPMHVELTKQDIRRVCEVVNAHEH